ncbi:MAG: hypothetical protein ACR2HR_16100 [Euzebya sp.]
MNPIIALYVTVHMALTGAVDRTVERIHSEDGQGTVEWIGIAAVTIAVAAAVIATRTTMGEAVRDAFTNLIGRATNPG